MLREDPELHAKAKPALRQEPNLGERLREFFMGDFDHNNLQMDDLPWADRSPSNLDQLMYVVEASARGKRWTPSTEVFDCFSALASEAIKPPKKAKAMGDGWGFSQVAFTPGTFVRMRQLRNVLPLEDDLWRSNVTADGRIRFQAGMTFAELNQCLARSGRTVLNQPGFQPLTFGGVMSVGGHGSGKRNGNIASQVDAVEMVHINAQGKATLTRVECPDAPLADPAKWKERYPHFNLEQSREDLFRAARVSAGYAGVIYAVTVRTQPAFFLEEDRDVFDYPINWKEPGPYQPRVDELLAMAEDPSVHSVHVWLNPYAVDGRHKGVRSAYTRTTQPPQGQRGWGIVNADKWWAVAMLQLAVAIAPETLPWAMNASLDSVDSKDVVMPSPEALDFGPPNNIPVIAASCGVRADIFPEVMTALLHRFEQMKSRGLYVSSPIGCRWVQSSTDFLAPQFGHDTVMIEVPVVKGTPNAEETLAEYVDFMISQFGARPHWGQRNLMSRERYLKAFGPESVELFAKAVHHFDPLGVFQNVVGKALGIR